MEGKPEINQPQFPALYMCVVVDARVSSRKDILRDLKATSLFENLIEAKSLDNGLQLIENHAVDACFIGPAVSLAKAATFIQQASASELSKHCAFITIAAGENIDRAALELAGSHQVIDTPYSKMKFAECIVRGVAKANAGSKWAGILLNAEQDNVNLFSHEIVGIISPNPKPPPSFDEEPQTSTQRMGTALLKASPQMKQIIKKIESGAFGVDPDGNPDRRAKEALEKLVSTILGETDIGQKTDGFSAFFESALFQWFKDVNIYGTKDANEELKKRLATYSE